MDDVKRKTIVVKQTTYDKLVEYGKFGQSTEDVILTIFNLLDELTKENKLLKQTKQPKQVKQKK
jgi:hypothetical protein